VLLTRKAAEQAIPSLLGMALDYAPTLDRHDSRRKVGIITRADIRGRNVEIGGYLFARDFPEVVREIRLGGRRSRPFKDGGQRNAMALGMSYEITDARIEDLKSGVWTVSEFTFTGAAVLRRDKAAYRDTWIEME
jgi:hypothetical protein